MMQQLKRVDIKRNISFHVYFTQELKSTYRNHDQITSDVHTLTGVTIHQIDACNLQIPTKTNRGKSSQVVNRHQESDQGAERGGARDEHRSTNLRNVW